MTREPIRAVCVCVDYSDLLAITMPYNRHHFSDVLIVTSPMDLDTIRVAIENGCEYYRTNAFYADGADFNKWLALEEALDRYERKGWLCMLDADVLWPKYAPLHLTEGNLYTPLRRMCIDLKEVRRGNTPKEETWRRFSVHRNIAEFAGYSQIFHAADQHLGYAPWHETNWKHAGGADSFFQRKWPNANKIRPPFEVLHLGPAGANWCGRSSEYVDGSKHPDSIVRAQKVEDYWAVRRTTRSYDNEKLH